MTQHALDRLRAIAGPVSRETFQDLQQFLEMFRQWAARINLVAPSTLPDLWERHVLDSAQLARLKPDALLWTDLGSGGGFPGLILAFLLRERSGSSIRLVESNRKKSGFLQAAIGRFSLPAKVFSVRIEDAPPLIGRSHVVTARALAELPLLLELAAPWLQDGATGLFHKGRDYRQEVQESINHWEFDLLEHRSKVDDESIVLEINALRRRDQGS